MDNTTILLSPFDLGPLSLPNRIVMPAMTRGRTPVGGVPTVLAATYYAQRASAGLVISEGTSPMPGGTGIPGVPGIYTQEQVVGWRRVSDAVHSAGGRFFIQLWHVGRASSSVWQPDNQPPIGVSAVAGPDQSVMSPSGSFVNPDIPREASRAEIGALIEGFACAARNAIAAGCDGVELHGANGYLIQQFFSLRSNRRNDAYGGSVMNRIRFAVELAEAVAAAIGPNRTGIRISPLSNHQGAPVDDPTDLYSLLLRALEPLGLAFIHAIEGEPGGANVAAPGDTTGFNFHAARRLTSSAWIANNFYDVDRAARAITAGDADFVSLGRLLISNPDLVQRIRTKAPLNKLRPETFYGGTEVGYTDYPFLGSGLTTG